MKKQINFADVKSAEEFRTRFGEYYEAEYVRESGRCEWLRDENGERIFAGNRVSVGCYWPHLKQFMTEERVSDDQIKVGISYSNWSGTGFVWRFV